MVGVPSDGGVSLLEAGATLDTVIVVQWPLLLHVMKVGIWGSLGRHEHGPVALDSLVGYLERSCLG